MQRLKIRLPATVTNLGAGIGCLGLALELYATVQIVEREDDALIVEASGEGAGDYAVGWRHPVVLGAGRVFQHCERAVTGLTIRVENAIPFGAGLGVEPALMLAGIIGANALLDYPLKRPDLLRFAARAIGRADHVVTALLGGLTSSTLTETALLDASLTIAPLKVVIIAPTIPGFSEKARASTPRSVPLADALHNLSRLPLLIDGLRSGDHGRIAMGLDDRLLVPRRQQLIPGYDQLGESLRDAGASAWTLTGGGAGVIVFAAKGHEQIADAAIDAFADVGIHARTWIIPVDRQGLVMSAARSS